MIRVICGGGGLASRNKPSFELGGDILSMIFRSLLIVRENRDNKIIKCLGTTGYNITSEEWVTIYGNRKRIFNTLRSNLLKMNFILDWFSTHELESSLEFIKIRKETLYRAKHVISGNVLENYKYNLRYQTPQFVYLAKKYEGIRKVGWTFDNKVLNGKIEPVAEAGLESHLKKNAHCEHYFDTTAKVLFPEIYFAAEYVSGSLNLENKQRPPYTVTQDEVDTRFVIDRKFGESVERAKIIAKTYSFGLKYLKPSLKRTYKNIVVPYENLFGRIDSNYDPDDPEMLELCTIQKIEYIQNKLIGEILR